MDRLEQPQITSVLISVSSVAQFRELLAATRLKSPSVATSRLGPTVARPPPRLHSIQKQPI